MDIRVSDDVATADERAAVDGVLDTVLGPSEVAATDDASAHWRGTRGGQVVSAQRQHLLPVLHTLNDHIGWISPGALNYLCQRLTIPPAEAYGVASFYGLFSMTPRPARQLHVCTDLACTAAGAGELTAALQATSSPAATVTGGAWHPSPCLGMCERAPAALLMQAGPEPYSSVCAPATRDELVAMVAGEDVPMPAAELHASAPQHGDPALRLLRRVGVVDPESLDDYRAFGGYEALRRAVEIGPEATVREVVDSGLVGRGGAAFPTGRKWDAVAHHPRRPHYLVCNADESEPGTFKDRVLLEGDPYAVIEAMTIAAFATGCERGYVYLRGEYPLALARLENAIAQARRHELLGANVMNAGFAFDIEVRRGAGAYICGEETAIFSSIEGYRGEPRSKPPFPVDRGLFGMPTVVNNVETLANVPLLLREGGARFAESGAAASRGSKLFCVSGNVARPGVYELPFGVTVRELLEQAGANVPRLQAVLLGGAAGSFLAPADLDLPLTFEATRAAGFTIGSGVVMAFDDSADVAALLLRIAAFFRDESCGQCVPCRVGTVRQEEALRRLVQRQGSPRRELQLLRDTGLVMRDASICGLGQTAWNAIESALDRLDLARSWDAP